MDLPRTVHTVASALRPFHASDDDARRYAAALVHRAVKQARRARRSPELVLRDLLAQEAERIKGVVARADGAMAVVKLVKRRWWARVVGWVGLGVALGLVLAGIVLAVGR